MNGRAHTLGHALNKGPEIEGVRGRHTMVEGRRRCLGAVEVVQRERSVNGFSHHGKDKAVLQNARRELRKCEVAATRG